jgi:WD40 repeat protein
MTAAFDPQKLRRTATARHACGLFAAAYDPVSQRVVAGGVDGRLVAWDPARWAEPPVAFHWQHRSYVYAVAALPAQQQVVSAGYDRRLVWWDPLSGSPLREAELPARPQQLAVAPDGRTLAVVDDDRTLRLFDAATGAPTASYADHPQYTPKMHLSTVYAVAYSPDGRWLATGDRCGSIVVRAADSGTVVRRLHAPRFYGDFSRKPDGQPNDGEYELGGVRMLAFSPDGSLVVAGGMGDYNPNSAGTDGKMGLTGFDTATGEERFSVLLAKDQGYLQTAQFHASGLLVAAGGGGTGGDTGVGALCVLDPARPDAPTTHSLEMTVRSVLLLPDERGAVVVGMHKKAAEGQLEHWQTADAAAEPSADAAAEPSADG